MNTLIGKLQHSENFKLSYLSTCKWVIRLILSDQVNYDIVSGTFIFALHTKALQHKLL